MMPCTVSGSALAREAPVRAASGRTPRRRAGCPRRARGSSRCVSAARTDCSSSRPSRRAVSTSESGRSDTVAAFALPPPQPGRRSSSSGRAVATTSSGTPLAQSARWSTKSSSPSSAQWRSSNTSTGRPLLGEPLEEPAPGGERSRCADRPYARRRRGRRAAACARAPTRPQRRPARVSPTASASFASATCGGVGLEDSRLCLRHLAERPEADALAVGQAAALPPRDQLGLGVDRPEAAPRPAGSCRCPGRRRA